MRRASKSAVSKDFTLTLISVFRDCLLHFKATLTETYLKFSHALGKTVVTESKALSFCPYSKTISSFHSEIVIIISCHSSVLILTGDHVSQCCWLAFWLCCYFCIQTSEFLGCVSSCGACSWRELIHTNLFLASCSGCFC